MEIQGQNLMNLSNALENLIIVVSQELSMSFEFNLLSALSDSIFSMQLVQSLQLLVMLQPEPYFIQYSTAGLTLAQNLIDRKIGLRGKHMIKTKF